MAPIQHQRPRSANRFPSLLAAIGLSLAFALPAKANSIAFAPALSYSTIKATDNAGVLGPQDTKVLVLDLRLGYLMSDPGLYLGAIYKLESDSYSNGDLKGFALGPSIGFVNGGFSAILSYHLLAERRYTFSGVERKLSQGRGPQFDIAWAPQIAQNVGLGPQITYKSIRYERTQIGQAAETSNSYEETTLEPSIVFWFSF